MPRTALTVQPIVSGGLANTQVAGDQANGHEYVAGSKTFLHVVNADASPINVTITSSFTKDGNALADKVVVCPATDEIFLGPFPTDTYGSGADDALIYVDLSADTTVTIGAYSI